MPALVGERARQRMHAGVLDAERELAALDTPRRARRRAAAPCSAATSRARRRASRPLVGEVDDAELARERVGGDCAASSSIASSTGAGGHDRSDRADGLEQLELVGELLRAARAARPPRPPRAPRPRALLVGLDAALGRAEDDDHVGHDRHDHRAVRVVRAEDEPAVVVVDANRPRRPQGVGERRLVGQRDLDDPGPAFAAPAAAEMDEAGRPSTRRRTNRSAA